jgi:hypothetical protein
VEQWQSEEPMEKWLLKLTVRKRGRWKEGRTRPKYVHPWKERTRSHCNPRDITRSYPFPEEHLRATSSQGVGDSVKCLGSIGFHALPPARAVSGAAKHPFGGPTK